MGHIKSQFIESLLSTESLLTRSPLLQPEVPVMDSFIAQTCIDLSLEPVARRVSSWLNAQHDTYRLWPKIEKIITLYFVYIYYILQTDRNIQ